MTDTAITTGAAHPEPPLSHFLHGPLPKGVEDHLLRLRKTEGIRHIAVMPDVHLASEFCVGTVIASDEFLFPNAVGGDIGCGMLALRFNAPTPAHELFADPDKAARLLGQLTTLCPGRRHHRKTAHDLPQPLRDMPLSDSRLDAAKLGEDSRLQLGTLGAGNHFLEFQSDEATGDLWLMLHTGSRHLGQTIFHHHLPRARRVNTGIFALDTATPEGRAYFNDVQIARAWAKENRRLLAARAADAIHHIYQLTPDLQTLYDCDHNHLSLERHDGRGTFIHRKGATLASLNTPGIIPGSMGTRSFHTLGKGNPDALHSSSHGAGRSLSRTEARNKITTSALRQQLTGVWYDSRLERHLREEAPTAYKKIEDVMSAQDSLTTITRRLRPLLVHKAI